MLDFLDRLEPAEFSIEERAESFLIDLNGKVSKHYYPSVGELKSEGEEFECAEAIDRCALVKH